MIGIGEPKIRKRRQLTILWDPKFFPGSGENSLVNDSSDDQPHDFVDDDFRIKRVGIECVNSYQKVAFYKKNETFSYSRFSGKEGRIRPRL